jgi:hypothetical protein
MSSSVPAVKNDIPKVKDISAVEVKDGSLVISLDGKQENYKLGTIPPDNCVPVLIAKQTVLGQLDLNQLVRDMWISTKLAHTAYMATNSVKGVQSDISGIRKNLISLIGDSSNTLQDFGDKSSIVLNNLIEAYKYLQTGSTESALTLLNTCSEIAKDMTEKALELRNSISGLETSAQDAVEKTIEAKATTFGDAELLRQKAEEFTAKAKATQAVVDNLAARISRAQEEYEEQKEKVDTLEKREFVLSIVSAACGALSAGLSAGIQAYTTSSTMGMSNLAPAIANAANGSTVKAPPAIESTPIESDSPELASKKEELVEVKDEIQKIDSKIDDLDDKIEAYQEKSNDLANVPTSPLSEDAKKVKITETTKEAVDEKLKELVEEKKEAVEERAPLSKQANELRAEISALASAATAALNSARDSTLAMAQQAGSAAEKAEATLSEMRKAKNLLEDQNTLALKELTLYTESIKNSASQAADLDLVINSLQIAITCLNTIIGVLDQMRLFWDRIATACKTLADDNTRDLVSAVKKQAKQDLLDLELITDKTPPAEQIKLINATVKDIYSADTGFNWSFFNLFVRWQALRQVCFDYAAAVTVSYAYGQECLKIKEPKREEAFKIAQGLSEELDDVLKERE